MLSLYFPNGSTGTTKGEAERAADLDTAASIAVHWASAVSLLDGPDRALAVAVLLDALADADDTGDLVDDVAACATGYRAACAAAAADHAKTVRQVRKASLRLIQGGAQ